jgi:large conductance mechanosensitive channel
MDMAIGIVIGAAFGKIVTSFVSDILMPPIGLLLGGVDFSNIFVVLGEGDYATIEAAKEAGAATWNVGLFINTVIDFVIIAFAIFLVVKALNNMKRKEAVPPPAPSEKSCTFCTTSIPIKATRCPNCTSQLEPS